MQDITPAPIIFAFEGINGAGKTTQAQLLEQHLNQAGYPVCACKEPGDTPLGAAIRATLANLEEDEIEPTAAVLLFSAARRQLTTEKILPAVAKGEIIVMDRYRKSTLAYQGHGQGVLESARLVERVTFEGRPHLEPTLNLLLDLDPKEAISRVQERTEIMGIHQSRFEEKNMDFYQRVAQGYRTEAHQDPSHWLILKADRPPEVVADQAWQAVQQVLAQVMPVQKSKTRVVAK